MTRAKYNSPNQLFRSLDLNIPFSEFLDKMKSRFGDNFFEMYDRDELSYDQIQAVALEKNSRQTTPPISAVDASASSSTTQRNNTLKTILIVGALGYIAYTIYKKSRG